MANSIDDLTTPLTVDSVKKSIFDVLAGLGVSTTGWKVGAVVRTMIFAVAVLVAALSQLQANIAKSGFLEFSITDWLTIVAKQVYGVDRLLASNASGNVVLDNGAGGLFTVAIDELTVRNSATGKTYRNSAAFTLDPFETGEIVPVVAVESGSDSNAIAGEIDEFETVLAGVTVTNPAALIGNDDEEDPALRTRSKQKLGSLSPNGPPDAYGFVARGGAPRSDGSGTVSGTRADGTNIGVNRVNAVPDGKGGIDVFVATPTGPVTGPDLAIINDDLEQLATPLGITLRTFSAAATPISITYEIWLYNTTGLTETEIRDAINDELTDLIQIQPIGGNIIGAGPGKVYISAIKAAIGRAHTSDNIHLGIFRVEVTAPAADFTLLPNQVPTLGPVAGALNQIVSPGNLIG